MTAKRRLADLDEQMAAAEEQARREAAEVMKAVENEPPGSSAREWARNDEARFLHKAHGFALARIMLKGTIGLIEQDAASLRKARARCGS